MADDNDKNPEHVFEIDDAGSEKSSHDPPKDKKSKAEPLPNSDGASNSATLQPSTSQQPAFMVAGKYLF